MSGKVTFTTASFTGAIGTDGSGNLFINTNGNQKQIIFDKRKAFSGSVELDLDTDGTTVLAQHFTEANSVISLSGSQPAFSGSSQIQMDTFLNGAIVSVSGSGKGTAGPGFNVIAGAKRGVSNTARLRSNYLGFIGEEAGYIWTQGVTNDGSYSFTNNAVSVESAKVLTLSSSGDVYVHNGKLIAEEYIVSSSVTNVSTLAQSGSTRFGDTIDDTHQFTGSILIDSGSVSGSHQSTGSFGRIEISGEINAKGNIVGDDGTNITNIAQISLDAIAADANSNTQIGVGSTSIGFDVDGETRLELGTTKIEVGDTVTEGLFVNTHITSSGNISASGDMFANSGSFNYITASKVDVDSDSIRIGGESINKTLITNLKRGHSSTTLSPAGRIQKTNDVFVSGQVSASGGFIGGTVSSQLTGSYDFPGAIMGYNVQGLNSSHHSYNLTSTMAVPDDGHHVQFIAPKSGIVEIEVQVTFDLGSSSGTFIYLGLSDQSATDGYNSLQSYYEQAVADPDENDDVSITHKWVVPSLTPGTQYKYWLGVRCASTSGTPKLVWGGSTANRFRDFIMKATALPSNTEIES
jgi:hypothetical protein